MILEYKPQAQMFHSKESKRPMMFKICTIGVFGGSKLGKNEEFREAANDLGRALAARKINLIYGGGHGLKGCTAGSAAIRGSQILNVVAKDDADTKFFVGTELRVETRHDRMGYMLRNADAFIVLPGGLGTLEEFFCFVFWANQNVHKKPLGLLNINGFYDGFLSLLDNAVEQGFMPQAKRGIILSALTADELLDKLQNSLSEFSQKHANQPNKGGSRKRKLDTTLML